MRTHELYADVSVAGGGEAIALERVESHVECDDREERSGRYELSVRLAVR